MTEKEEGVLLSDVQWIKTTLDSHCKDPDNKNLGAYKKLTWLNFVGLAGLAWASIKVALTS